MPAERVHRRLAAILAADVVGYSRMMEADEAGTLATLKSRLASLLEPLVAEYRGRIFKLMGDGVLVEFASAIDAVECAVAYQRSAAELDSAAPPDRRLEMRIGINLGDVMVEGSDLYGDGVNIAARLQTLADPGGVCVSGKLHDEVGRKLDVGFDALGERTLKNIAAPVQVFRLSRPGAPAPAEPDALPLPDKPSIAILPFDNLSGDPDQQYFSDGIAQDIITDLSKVSGLFVIARNSSFGYRGPVKVQDVCRALGVRYVLAGNVRRSGDRVRISAELIDGTTGGQLWAERYDRSLVDIFAVQDEVTQEVVAALAVTLTPDERRRLERNDPENLEAYDLYLRGRQLTFQFTRESSAEAGDLLRRAIELDPKLTRAYSILSHMLLLAYVNGWHGQLEETLARANELARQAVALDGDEPEAHWNLGLTCLWLRQHELAIAEEQRAVRLDPNYASPLAGLGNVLHYAGRSAEGIEPLLTAIRLDPHHSDLWLHFLGLAYFGAGRYEEAAASLRRRLIRQPNTDTSRVLLAACCGYLGRPADAQALWQEALRCNPSYSLEEKRRILPYKDPADFDHLVEGLRKAGVPA